MSQVLVCSGQFTWLKRLRNCDQVSYDKLMIEPNLERKVFVAIKCVFSKK